MINIQTTPRILTRLLAAARCLVLLFAGHSALAATVTWTGSGDGVNWSDPANWTGSAVPPVGSDVVIPAMAGKPAIKFGFPGSTVALNTLTLNGTMFVGAADRSMDGIVNFGDGSATPARLTASTGKTATVLFGGDPYYTSLQDDTNGAGLTFAANVMVHGNYGFISSQYGLGIGFINQGTINADTAGGTITVNSPALTNTGTMTASNGGILTVSNLVSNTGTISETNSTLNLARSFTIAALGTITRTGGAVNLTGTLDNTGGTLTLDATTGPWNLAGGTIKGGTINCGTVAGGGSFLVVTTSGGYLDGVTVNGDLDVSQVNGADLGVLNTLTLNGTMYVGAADGSTAGYVGFGNFSTSLPAGLTASTGKTATVVFGGGASSNLSNDTDGGTVTFAPNVTVRGSRGSISNLNATGGSFVNQGTINADIAGGRLPLAKDWL